MQTWKKIIFLKKTHAKHCYTGWQKSPKYHQSLAVNSSFRLSSSFKNIAVCLSNQVYFFPDKVYYFLKVMMHLQSSIRVSSIQLGSVFFSYYEATYCALFNLSEDSETSRTMNKDCGFITIPKARAWYQNCLIGKNTFQGKLLACLTRR